MAVSFQLHSGGLFLHFRTESSGSCDHLLQLPLFNTCKSHSVFQCDIKRSALTLAKYYTLYTEKAMAPHSSTLAWKIPWTEEPGRLQSMRLLRVGHDWAISLSCIGEGNGNPLQCSCLENPRDGGAWWASIYGVAQSWTRLKQLSSSSICCTHLDFSSSVKYIPLLAKQESMHY